MHRFPHIVSKGEMCFTSYNPLGHNMVYRRIMTATFIWSLQNHGRMFFNSHDFIHHKFNVLSHLFFFSIFPTCNTYVVILSFQRLTELRQHWTCRGWIEWYDLYRAYTSYIINPHHNWCHNYSHVLVQ